jgi:LysR family transcriptional activator of nhaA
MRLETLNLHHLRYFWAVARDGNLTRTARRMRVAQSALSSQIRQLEEQLEEPLFVRDGRRLVLTEAGKLVLAYADEIFQTAEELLATLEHGRSPSQRLRVGAVATLSRNFQESFVKPLLADSEVHLQLQSGSLDELLSRLLSHGLDVVLSTRAPRRESGAALRCRRIARQQVSLVGHKRRRAFRFPDDLAHVRMIVPGPESDVRSEFDALCEQLGVPVRIVAEVDDMAMMRLLARDMDVVALVPTVVVRDELTQGALHEYGIVPGLFERFFAITVSRHYQHPLVRKLLSRDEADILAMQPAGP